MDASLALKEVMHQIAQGLLAPTMVVLVLMVVLAVGLTASVIAEWFTERRHFKNTSARTVNDIENASYGEVSGIIERTELLRSQKAALVVVAKNMGLGEDKLFALAQMQTAAVEERYKKRLAITDTVSKVGPMLGLMATLIPLGPGIVAMGMGDTETLSSSLLIAFDATVCGLVSAVVSLVLSKVRSTWYDKYLAVLDALMTCILEKAGDARSEGVKLPADYAEDPTKMLEAYDAAVRGQRKADKAQKRAAKDGAEDAAGRSESTEGDAGALEPAGAEG